MMGVFVQLNEGVRNSMAAAHPIGYVVQESGCWDWVGCVSHGYGVFRRGRRAFKAHRVVYEIHRGPIPAGLELDHLCRNTTCVNPSHLEAVTRIENNRRSNTPPAINARKTHCKYGHKFTPENTREHIKGQRMCRTCEARLRREARKARTYTRPTQEGK